MQLVQHVFDTVARLFAALAIAAVAYFCAVTAFHPFHGPLEGYQLATYSEKGAALGLSGIIFCAVAWRLLIRRTDVRKEVRDAEDAFSDVGDS